LKWQPHVPATNAVQGIEVDWEAQGRKALTIRVDAHVVRDREGNLEFLEGFIEDISERRGIGRCNCGRGRMEAIGLWRVDRHDVSTNLLGGIIGYSDLWCRNNRSGQKPANQCGRTKSRRQGDAASTLTSPTSGLQRQQVLEQRC